MGKDINKRFILLVCAGNTCRSPMAKVTLKQLLERDGKVENYVVDSAGCSAAPGTSTSFNARKAIQELFGEDLLRSHKAKGLI